MASNSTISVTFRLNGDQKSFQALVRDTEGLKKAMNGAVVEAERLPKSLKGISSSLAGLATGFLSFKALFDVVKTGIGTIKDFERANSELASVLGTNIDGISALTTQALELGRTTEFTAKDVTSLQNALARLGFTQSQIVDMSEGVLKFASAVGTDLGSAAEFTGAVLRSFGLQSSQTGAMLDVLAASTSKSALSFEKLSTGMSIVAPVAASLGFGVKDVAALLGSLSNAGFDASSAATALRNIFLYLADDTSKLSKAMGGGVTDIDGLIAGLQKLQDSGIDTAEMLELTDKRSVAAFATFISGTESLRQLRTELDNANGSLGSMYSTVSDNLEGAIRGLSSAWEGFTLALNSSDGIMKNIIQDMSRMMNYATDLLSGKGVQQANYNFANAGFENEVTSYINRKQKEGVKTKTDWEVEYARQAAIIANEQAKIDRGEVKRQKLYMSEKRINDALHERTVVLRAIERLYGEIQDSGVDVNKVGNVRGQSFDNPSGNGAVKKTTIADKDYEKFQAEDKADSLRILTEEERNLEKASDAAYESLMRMQGLPTGAEAKAQEVRTFVESIEELDAASKGIDPTLQGFLDKVQNGLTDNAVNKVLPKKKDISNSISAIGSLSNALSALSGMVKGSAEGWLSWSSNLLTAVASVIPAVATLVAAHKAATKAATEQAVTEGAAAVAGIPIAGPGLAVAASATILASLLATIASIPKFAKGGIAYGPTLGMFGEYAGASNNPEVVAPLDKLRDLIFDGGGSEAPRVVELHASGRDLYGIIKLEESMRRRG